MRRLFGFCGRFFEERKGTIVLLLLVVSLIGVVSGWRYMKYTRSDPQFCATCHVLQESFVGWEKSSHRDIICQECHRMSVLEQNRLLMVYVLKGYTAPAEHAHGRLKPWKSCRGCHIDAVKQGAITLRASYGHARHVFMENIECMRCHSPQGHDFKPDERACGGCHADRLVHGLGMEGLSCLKCHSYGEKTSRPVSSERCMGCHKDIPRSGPMAGLRCLECHKPHGKIKLQSADCLGQCHGNEASVGQHGIHMKKTGIACLDCHKAHKWTVGPKEAKRLCARCHPLRDPRSFIY